MANDRTINQIEKACDEYCSRLESKHVKVLYHKDQEILKLKSKIRELNTKPLLTYFTESQSA